MMTSFADKIASLTNPIPKVIDPEDDVNIETVAKFNESSDAYEKVYSASKLRSKTAPLLEDIDPAYAGRKVSRKALDNIFQDESTFTKKDNECKKLAEESDESENSYSDDDSDGDEELNDGDLELFRHSVPKQDINSDAEESEGDESEISEESDEHETSEDMVNKFSNIDVTSEIEKGENVKAQLEMWNNLSKIRIILQKLLIRANQLPQADCWKILQKRSGDDGKKTINKGSNSVKNILSNCLKLREQILNQNPETSSIDNIDKNESGKGGNEDILSDTDEEMELSHNKEPNPHIERKSSKRKLECEEYGDILAKHHQSLIPYRNSVIQKWDDKTKLSSGRITQKSFSAFDNSALKQIEKILQDESRLIKRTQLKRSLYKVLGKPEVPENKSVESSESVSQQDLLLRDYDPEIFDDDDFYRQFLKDVIETTSIGIDPAILRKQMEIQNVRNKMKRKVDTKASKGRKIRYDIHPKLVNFMAPVETCTISDEARDNLLKCLFGKSAANTS